MHPRMRPPTHPSHPTSEYFAAATTEFPTSVVWKKMGDRLFGQYQSSKNGLADQPFQRLKEEGGCGMLVSSVP